MKSKIIAALGAVFMLIFGSVVAGNVSHAEEGLCTAANPAMCSDNQPNHIEGNGCPATHACDERVGNEYRPGDEMKQDFRDTAKCEAAIATGVIPAGRGAKAVGKFIAESAGKGALAGLAGCPWERLLDKE